jgi:uncharacterized iron-regulated membrane protein
MTHPDRGSMDADERRRRARTLRLYRKLHRTTGVALFAFFFVVACTGLLLGWKKHSRGFILPESHRGASTELADWLPIDELHSRAVTVFRDSISTDLSLELERIDIRPRKGMVKFVFVDHYWGIQLDGATGELLHIERRRSDFIENFHDGSILDHVFGTDGEWFKLGYTTIMGSSLILFTVTGFWLWMGPKRFRTRRKVPRG